MSKDRDNIHGGKADITTILVPIRYPLTAESAQTLEYAKQVAQESHPTHLQVLHVDLIQNVTNAQKEEIIHAVSPIVEGMEASVSVCRGFLIEEVILEEGNRIDADIIVVGQNQKSIWRQFVNRILGENPDVGAYLQQNIDAQIEVV